MKSIFKFLNSNKLYKYSLITLIMSGFAALVYAASVPNTFTEGTIAKSSEVNANFTYLQERLPGADHLWGQGRPNTQRYGTAGEESGLCTGPTGVKFGLSLGIASWGSAASQCPADTWVCTNAERGTGACDTARNDGSIDGLECFDTPAATLDFASDSHDGWLADITGLTDGDAISESGGTGNHWVCMSLPVWCCS